MNFRHIYGGYEHLAKTSPALKTAEGTRSQKKQGESFGFHSHAF